MKRIMNRSIALLLACVMVLGVVASVPFTMFAAGVDYQHNASASSDENAQNAKVTAERYKKYSAKRNWLLLYAREIIWKFGNWKTAELDRFIEEFKPEVVFFSMEGYIHLDRIARYVIKKTGAKGVGYFCSDYSFGTLDVK